MRHKFIEELFDNIFGRRKIVEGRKADIKYSLFQINQYVFKRLT